MTITYTFLGKGGTGKTTIAFATAKRYASQGKRVLFVGQEPASTLSLILGANIGPEPTEIDSNLKAVNIQAASLLESGWEELKKLEAEYLRTPFFKNVYGQELGVLPGVEGILTINVMRGYSASGEYDVIIYDGTGDKETLRLLGSAEIMSWYIRRFRQVILDSDLYKAISPFVQPISSAILNVDWTGDNFSQPTEKINELLDNAKSTIADPNRVAAYLVTTDDKAAIATARYLWGSAQQVNLTVGGVILNQADLVDNITAEFTPLSVAPIPRRSTEDWKPLMDALPDFSQAVKAPKPIIIDIEKSQVSLFLPSFDKKQIGLTTNGPEVTIEAGDQRRNIFLPPPLSGKPVRGAKFQNDYLIISF
ncbi:MAG: ArsA family ATPase [Okeania sp. SIO2F4]|uniref:Get3/ArsA fold putative tail anchor-mediating ATPase NosAFP n=1 Tax=Okeania sp. SIO2F4 TaxID=2607790 RepID=UPI00142B825C|nr:ArsA family ATPase [Okeania sp. SIO2F4]NES03324.1 ArsA family ATPase [Okeania sp. SIO2F4]